MAHPRIIIRRIASTALVLTVIALLYAIGNAVAGEWSAIAATVLAMFIIFWPGRAL